MPSDEMRERLTKPNPLLRRTMHLTKATILFSPDMDNFLLYAPPLDSGTFLFFLSRFLLFIRITYWDTYTYSWSILVLLQPALHSTAKLFYMVLFLFSLILRQGRSLDPLFKNILPLICVYCLEKENKENASPTMAIGTWIRKDGFSSSIWE